MKMLLSTLFVVCFTFSSSILADNTKPIELSAAQMDLITASGLGLPNGTEVFPGFDNPAPFELHPTFDSESGGARSPNAAAFPDGSGSATGDPNRGGHGPPNGDFGNEGPWSSHVMSPVIECIGC